MEGIAVWFYSDYFPLSIWRIFRSVPLAIFHGFARYGGEKMRKLGVYLEQVHKRTAPFRHMHLQMLGVDHTFQGKGYCGRLVKSAYKRMDEESLPCCLEELDKQNVLIYEHLGFDIADKLLVPGTEITNWAMLSGKIL